MHYQLTQHALQRMQERGISFSVLEETLASPDQIWYEEGVKVQFRKRITQDSKEFLLIAVAVHNEGLLRIITVIQTSKIKKYL